MWDLQLAPRNLNSLVKAVTESFDVHQPAAENVCSVCVYAEINYPDLWCALCHCDRCAWGVFAKLIIEHLIITLRAF